VPGIEAIVAEFSRLSCLRAIEERLGAAGWSPVAGVDEAGRGCLAGPVVAAAVVPEEGRTLPGVDDSKQLEPEQRRRLAAEIRNSARAYAVHAVPAAEIDATNILQATRRAMLEALAKLVVRPRVVLVDAVTLGESELPCVALVKGDALSYAIACASILAKEHRDRLLDEVDPRYPHYGFVRHKGYAVPEHLLALERFGPTPEHRLTFARVVPRREAA